MVPVDLGEPGRLLGRPGSAPLRRGLHHVQGRGQEPLHLGLVAVRVDVVAHGDEEPSAALHEAGQLGALGARGAHVEEQDHVVVGEARLREALGVHHGGTHRGGGAGERRLEEVGGVAVADGRGRAVHHQCLDLPGDVEGEREGVVLGQRVLGQRHGDDGRPARGEVVGQHLLHAAGRRQVEQRPQRGAIPRAHAQRQGNVAGRLRLLAAHRRGDPVAVGARRGLRLRGQRGDPSVRHPLPAGGVEQGHLGAHRTRGRGHHRRRGVEPPGAGRQVGRHQQPPAGHPGRGRIPEGAQGRSHAGGEVGMQPGLLRLGDAPAQLDPIEGGRVGLRRALPSAHDHGGALVRAEGPERVLGRPPGPARGAFARPPGSPWRRTCRGRWPSPTGLPDPGPPGPRAWTGGGARWRAPRPRAARCGTRRAGPAAA